ncbi:hypothetical protein [Isoptericola sp. NPDC055881]
MTENEATGTSQQFAEGLFVESLRRALDAGNGPHAGLTQNSLANAMRARGHKFHQATIFKILKGDRKITLGEALDIASILQTTVEKMLQPGDPVVQRVVREVENVDAAAGAMERWLDQTRVSQRGLHEAMAQLHSEIRNLTPKDVLNRAAHYQAWTPWLFWVRSDIGPVEKEYLVSALAKWVRADSLHEERDEDAVTRDLR